MMTILMYILSLLTLLAWSAFWLATVAVAVLLSVELGRRFGRILHAAVERGRHFHLKL